MQAWSARRLPARYSPIHPLRATSKSSLSFRMAKRISCGAPGECNVKAQGIFQRRWISGFRYDVELIAKIIMGWQVDGGLIKEGKTNRHKTASKYG